MAVLMQKKKKITHFRPNVRSRHPSHQVLREKLPLLPFKSIVRLGSTTDLGDNRVECNSIQAIKNSADKLLMKRCFSGAEVKTASWISGINNSVDIIYTFAKLNYPIIAKSRKGSRGEGNTKIDNKEQLDQWFAGKNLELYIFEKFYTYSKEYRIHITKEGCFYTCRKLLKNDTPEAEQWHRHDENSVWILEDNAKFMKPANWNDIVADCVKALDSLGLDIGAFDVKTQGSLKENPEWIIIESCSAPSFGEITGIKYVEQIPKILIDKYNKK